jgi:hypothetical protein
MVRRAMLDLFVAQTLSDRERTQLYDGAKR